MPVRLPCVGGGTVAVVGGAVAGILLVRFSSILPRDLHADWRGRAWQGDPLNVVGRPHAGLDVTVLEHPMPTLYCLPGRTRQIVVTQGPRDVLSNVELRQVIAHERAHIRWRHHLSVLLAKVLATAMFGRLGAGDLPGRVSELAEMHAGDAANPSHRSDLTRAVALLAHGGLPVGAMGAGTVALPRVRRLREPHHPIAPGQRWGVFGEAIFAVATPVEIVVALGLNAMMAHYCPVTG